MAICIDSSADRQTIVVSTEGSVYEVIVLDGDRGEVLVHGGRHFAEFSPVVFLGSIADDGSLAPNRIDIGLRMQFRCGAQVVITSPVQSLSRHSAGITSPECTAADADPRTITRAEGAPG